MYKYIYIKLNKFHYKHIIILRDTPGQGHTSSDDGDYDNCTFHTNFILTKNIM
jgi:hypothetical protein